MSVSVPSGNYRSFQLVNLGANRWALKPEMGYSRIKGRWILEAAAGIWFFTDNDDFFGGTTLRQDSITSVQARVSYNVSRKIWLAVDGNWFGGGRTSADGTELSTLQSNSRVGVTLSVTVARGQSLKFAAHTGAFTSASADFDIATIAYQFGWGSGLRSAKMR